MAILTDIREGLAANLSTLPDVQISPHPLSNPTPPAIEISRREPLEYDRAFGRGLDRWELTVRALIAFTTDLGAQRKLDELLDPTGLTSVKTLIESDPTLGGVADDLHVPRVGGEQLFERNNTAYIGCEWSVLVFVSN